MSHTSKVVKGCSYTMDMSIVASKSVASSYPVSLPCWDSVANAKLNASSEEKVIYLRNYASSVVLTPKTVDNV